MDKLNKEVFWGEIAPSEHLVQFYGTDEAFLNSLEGFITGGLNNNESVIAIVTPEHATALKTRLNELGYSSEQLREQFICVDAKETLSKFLVNNWPDDLRFYAVVGDLLQQARKEGRRVRAFGEMVAIMWADGLNGATVRLEHLWHDLCKTESFSLFCAYPKSGFTENLRDSIKLICDAHSRMIEGFDWNQQSTCCVN